MNLFQIAGTRIRKLDLDRYFQQVVHFINNLDGINTIASCQGHLESNKRPYITISSEDEDKLEEIEKLFAEYEFFKRSSYTFGGRHLYIEFTDDIIDNWQHFYSYLQIVKPFKTASVMGLFQIASRVAANINISELSPIEIDKIKNEINWDVVWVKPSLTEEMGEVNRVSLEENLPVQSIIDAFNSGKLVLLNSTIWDNLDNYTDVSSVAEAIQYSDEFVRDWKRIIKGFESGSQMPAPIVLKMPSGVYTLVAGNTRLMLAEAFKIQPQIWLVLL